MMLPLELAAAALGNGIILLPGRCAPDVIAEVEGIMAAAPPRHFMTPWGKTMSAAITNCGPLGWISDRRGYRYSDVDPETGQPWPAMPRSLRQLAITSAAEAGYTDFNPDCCLINLYLPGTKMGLHQDRDEADFAQPIVSVSLGRAARFRFEAKRRDTSARTCDLHHRDVLVFGGPARLMYHGIDRLLDPPDSPIGNRRVNLTFRRVGAKSGAAPIR